MRKNENNSTRSFTPSLMGIQPRYIHDEKTASMRLRAVKEWEEMKREAGSWQNGIGRHFSLDRTLLPNKRLNLQVRGKEFNVGP